MPQFIINGGKKLSGQITVNPSKNAATATLIGSLVNKGETTLRNVPQIEEINRLIEVLTSIGVKITKKGKNLIIKPPKKYRFDKIDKKAAERTRSIIYILGALAGQQKKYSLPQAGGCRLGSRTVKPHTFALENLGMNIKTTKSSFDVNTKKLKPAEFALYETGDTVTGNALLAAAQIPGKSIIRMASANYMVQDTCFFLQTLGVKIKGIGTSTLEITGKKSFNKRVSYTISEDPIDAMLFLSSAIITNSSITIKRAPIEFLELELLKLQKMGFKYKLGKKYRSYNKQTKLVDITTYPSKLNALDEKIHAMPFPGLNQDNLPFFVPIATKTKGETFIHDWTYEERAIYFPELNKLGARIKLIDNHRVTITGPSKLRPAELVCPPALRPAVIILVAMLGAKGESTLRNIYPILRGYERLEQRLSKLGADIRLEE